MPSNEDRLRYGATCGKVLCGRDRGEFQTYGELKAHLESCEACATEIADAQIRIQKVRDKMRAMEGGK